VLAWIWFIGELRTEMGYRVESAVTCLWREATRGQLRENRKAWSEFDWRKQGPFFHPLSSLSRHTVAIVREPEDTRGDEL
jgi:hypothetical protein